MIVKETKGNYRRVIQVQPVFKFFDKTLRINIRSLVQVKGEAEEWVTLDEASRNLSAFEISNEKQVDASGEIQNLAGVQMIDAVLAAAPTSFINPGYKYLNTTDETIYRLTLNQGWQPVTQPHLIVRVHGTADQYEWNEGAGQYDKVTVPVTFGAYDWFANRTVSQLGFSGSERFFNELESALETYLQNNGII